MEKLSYHSMKAGLTQTPRETGRSFGEAAFRMSRSWRVGSALREHQPSEGFPALRLVPVLG